MRIIAISAATTAILLGAGTVSYAAPTSFTASQPAAAVAAPSKAGTPVDAQSARANVSVTSSAKSTVVSGKGTVRVQRLSGKRTTVRVKKKPKRLPGPARKAWVKSGNTWVSLPVSQVALIGLKATIKGNTVVVSWQGKTRAKVSRKGFSKTGKGKFVDTKVTAGNTYTYRVRSGGSSSILTVRTPGGGQEWTTAPGTVIGAPGKVLSSVPVTGSVYSPEGLTFGYSGSLTVGQYLVLDPSDTLPAGLFGQVSKVSGNKVTVVAVPVQRAFPYLVVDKDSAQSAGSIPGGGGTPSKFFLSCKPSADVELPVLFEVSNIVPNVYGRFDGMNSHVGLRVSMTATATLHNGLFDNTSFISCRLSEELAKAMSFYKTGRLGWVPVVFYIRPELDLSVNIDGFVPDKSTRTARVTFDVAAGPFYQYGRIFGEDDEPQNPGMDLTETLTVGVTGTPSVTVAAGPGGGRFEAGGMLPGAKIVTSNTTGFVDGYGPDWDVNDRSRCLGFTMSSKAEGSILSEAWFDLPGDFIQSMNPEFKIVGLPELQVNIARKALHCWGSDPLTPTEAAAKVAAADESACALTNTGRVRCWGGGQLGDGSDTWRPDGVTVSLPEPATSIFAGEDHYCVILTSGKVWCWGRNIYGALGNNTNQDSNVPVEVIGVSNAVSGAGGFQHSCVVTTDKKLYCWGYQYFGQLGNRPVNSNIASEVPGLSEVEQVVAGEYTTCVLLHPGVVKCAGSNINGELGRDSGVTLSDTFEPLAKIPPRAVKSLSARNTNICATTETSQLWCWGSNNVGQLGDGTTNGQRAPIPTALQNITEQTATGQWHTCALQENQTVWCVGYNVKGQLGDGTTTDRHTWTQMQVPSSSPVVAVAAGRATTFLVLEDGSLWSVGWNNEGQLGTGSVDTYRVVPVKVSVL